jgi:hypothetical protein
MTKAARRLSPLHGDLDLLTLDSNGISCHPTCGRITRYRASGEIEGRPMPGADHSFPLKVTLREWASTVWTHVIKGIITVTDAKQRDAFVVELDEFPLS